MKIYFLLPILIYIVVPVVIVIALIYCYRKKRRIFRWMVWIPVLLFGMFAGAIICNEFEDYKRKGRMADQAGHLM